MVDSVKVLWPPVLAIVLPNQFAFTKAADGIQNEVAYGMGFSKEQILIARPEIFPQEKPEDIDVLKYHYKCHRHGAYYLPKLAVRPLDGRRLPKGTLKLFVFEELLMEGPIESFLPDIEPVNCMKLSGWNKSEQTYPAHPMMEGGADGGHQIGHVLLHDSKVHLRLEGVTAEEIVTLEISVLSAYYTTKSSEMSEEALAHQKELGLK